MNPFSKQTQREIFAGSKSFYCLCGCPGRAIMLWEGLDATERQHICHLSYQLHTTVMSIADSEVARTSLALLIFVEIHDSGYVLNLTL